MTVIVGKTIAFIVCVFFVSGLALILIGTLEGTELLARKGMALVIFSLSLAFFAMLFTLFFHVMAELVK